MTPLTDPAPQRVDAGRSTVASDPLAGRLDDLEWTTTNPTSRERETAMITPEHRDLKDAHETFGAVFDGYKAGAVSGAELKAAARVYDDAYDKACQSYRSAGGGNIADSDCMANPNG